MRQNTEIRMSPRYINNMMMFREYITKTKVPLDPVITRIYGKINLERDLLSRAVHKPPQKGKVVPPKKKDKDEFALQQIDRDFERQSKRIKEYHYDFNKSNQIKQSIHEQILLTDANQVINQEFQSPLSKKHFQILNTLQPELTFRQKLLNREPLQHARGILSETRSKQKNCEIQLQYEREYLGMPNMMEMNKIKPLKLHSNYESVQGDRKNSHESIINAITKSCREESSTFHKIIRKCKRVQGKFQSTYEGMLSQFYHQMK